MTTTTEKERALYLVEQFVDRFEPSYLLLAYHAALPLVFTPDLVGYLRTRFLYGQVPWVAEADLLLNLCRPVGYEQYVMETAVRDHLLSEMKAHPEFGPVRMEEVARLLIQYTRHLAQANPYLSQSELKRQQLSAMSYLEKYQETVIQEISSEFQSLLTSSDIIYDLPQINKNAVQALCNFAQKLAPQLKAYPEFIAYAGDVSLLLNAPDEYSSNITTQLVSLQPVVEIGGQKLPSLSNISSRVSHSYYRGYQNLPLRDNTFVGRAETVQHTIDALLSPEKKLVAICGAGGVGKTAVAIDVAHQCVEKRHFDSVVWLNAAQDISAQEKTVNLDDYVLDIIGKKLIGENQYNANKHKYYLRKLFRRQHVLIIFDGIDTHSHPSELLASLHSIPSPSKVLVTSRERPSSSSNVHSIMLNGLTLNETISLIRQEASAKNITSILSTSDEELKLIYGLIGGHPFAIKWVVSQMASLSLEEIVNDLQSNDQSEIYKILLENSWQLLSQNAKHLLVRIALSLPKGGKFDDLLLASTLPSPSLLDSIKELRNHSLIEVSPTVDLSFAYYDLHPLVRHSLLSSFDDPASPVNWKIRTRGEAEYRHMHYHLQLLREHSEDYEKIDIEFGQFNVALDYIFETGRFEEAVEFTSLLFDYWYILGHYREAENYLKQSFQFVEDNVSRLGRIYDLGEESLRIPPNLYRELHIALLDCGSFTTDHGLKAVFVDERIRPWQTQLPQSNNSTERVANLIRLLQNQYNTVGENALLLLLHVLCDRVDPGNACHHRLEDLISEFERVQQVDSKDLGAPPNITKILLYLGQISIQLGNYPVAESYLQKGLEQAQEDKNNKIICDYLYALGNVMFQQAQYNQVEAYYKEGLALADQIEYGEGKAQLLSGLGDIADVHENYAQAQTYYWQSQDIAEGLQLSELNILILAKLGNVKLHLNQFAEAEEYLQEALDLAVERRYHEGLILSYEYLGKVKIQVGDYLQAKENLERGLLLAQESDQPQKTPSFLISLAEIAMNEEANDVAADYLQMSLDAAQQFDNKILTAQALFVLAKIQREQDNFSKATAYAKESLSIFQSVDSNQAAEIKKWLENSDSQKSERKTLANAKNIEKEAKVAESKTNDVTTDFQQTLPKLLGNIPPRPSLVIGRENDIYYLKNRIGVGGAKKAPLTVVRGWPGVGKTTTVLTLVHQPGIAEAFPDGVLWAALGENPNPFSELAAWGQALGVADIGRLPTIEEAMARLTAVLHDKQMLLIIDDVWETEHGLPFKIAGKKCATIFTTRFQDVSRALADIPDDQIYKLPVLTDEKALELLQTLSPKTVEKHPDDSMTLVSDDLEGLPLAIQVAGRLLNEEHGMGWDVADLIADLREGAKLLAADAPADRADIVNQITPTVAALLKQSTDTLSEEIQIKFAFLGAFAPKPATFDLGAMAAVWLVDDPKLPVRILVDRGLLEPIGGRYQMHALLVAHAKSLLEDE